MSKITAILFKKRVGISRKNTSSEIDNNLQHLAFENSLQANIISLVSTGKVLLVNNAASKLLGYTKRELLTKSRPDIFNINESSFKIMLKQRKAKGKSKAYVTAKKKTGKEFPCEITSAIFKDDDGQRKAITTIVDMSHSILVQKGIDTQKSILVAENIVLAQAKSDARLAENNEWVKYIAKASYDVMWDWDIASGEIYVGDSIEEVFGYKVQNNTVKFNDFIECLLPEDKEAVEVKLTEALGSGIKNWDNSFMFKRKDGSLASTTSRASIIRDEYGKAIRLIGALQDVSRMQKLEKKLLNQININRKHNEKYFLAAKLSFDVLWDWNILTHRVFIGDGFEDLFGFSIKTSHGKLVEWRNHIHPDDRDVVERGLKDTIMSTSAHWECSLRIIRADGTIAYVCIKASIIRQTNGIANHVIGVVHDFSQQREAEDKLNREINTKRKLLNEYNENFTFIFNSTSDVLYDVDLMADKVLMSDAYEKEFGYKITSNMTPADVWASHVHPDDKEAVLQDYLRMLASGDIEWKNNYRFLRADNSVANVLSSRIVLRNVNGIAYRMIGSMQDVNKQRVLEERLEQEIKLKEKQILEAASDARETERADIGKELHDNVNQLLSASRLYLELAKQGGADSELYLSRSSEYTVTAIEEIRKLTKGLTTDIIKNIGLGTAIEELIRDSKEVQPVKIIFSLKGFSEQGVNNKFKLNIFRILQEAMNNILKYAKSTEISVRLLQNKRYIKLIISDDGIGFDTTKTRNGIGVNNIKSRAAFYNGFADFVSQPGKGCILTVTFPITASICN